MIWPAMLFNLCVGLLLAGFLLRAVRRFERRADAILAELDRRHAENMRNYDIARDQIRTSLHEQTDRAIAEMRAKSAGPHLPPISGNANIVLDGITVTATATVSPPPGEQLPTEQELAALPRWARVAFVARCARRVLALFKPNWPESTEADYRTIRVAIQIAEQAAATTIVRTEARVAMLNAAEVGHKASEVVFPSEASLHVAYAASVAAAVAAEVGGVRLPGDEPTEPMTLALVFARDALLERGQHHQFGIIRRDFDHLARLAKAQHWADDTPVPPSVFGPLWPDGPPDGWPKPEKPTTEIVFELDVPDDMTTAAAVELVKELSAAFCLLDLTGGGHGLAIQPPLEITAPATMPAGSSV